MSATSVPSRRWQVAVSRCFPEIGRGTDEAEPGLLEVRGASWAGFVVKAGRRLPGRMPYLHCQRAGAADHRARRWTFTHNQPFDRQRIGCEPDDI
jgi:hypothetical protein